MKTLALTSPHMRGPQVRDAQWLLGHNRFKDFHPGPRDGEFGPLAGAACKRAKYWLGYPGRAITPVFGDRLYAYLRGPKLGGKALPRSYRVRAKVRQKLAARKPRVKVLDVARSQIGVHESPYGSNRQKFGAWYGMNGAAWCAMFVSWCLTRAGKKFRYSYCPTILQDARAHRNGLRVVHTPEPGDIVLYGFGHSYPVHVGFFMSWRGSGGFYAIEGNTGVGNDANGGAVMRRSRSRSDVIAFVRVGR